MPNSFSFASSPCCPRCAADVSFVRVRPRARARLRGRGPAIIGIGSKEAPQTEQPSPRRRGVRRTSSAEADGIGPPARDRRLQAAELHACPPKPLHSCGGQYCGSCGARLARPSEGHRRSSLRLKARVFTIPAGDNKRFNLASEAPGWQGARRAFAGGKQPTSNDASRDGSGAKRIVYFAVTPNPHRSPDSCCGGAMHRICRPYSLRAPRHTASMPASPSGPFGLQLRHLAPPRDEIR